MFKTKKILNDDILIHGEPIQTDIGIMYPTLVCERLQLLQVEKPLYYHKITLLQNINKVALDCKKDGNIVQFEFHKELYHSIEKQDSMYEIILASKNKTHMLHTFSTLYEEYKLLFIFFFKEDVFDKIKTRSDFDKYIQMMREINGIEWEPPHPNPDVRRDREAQRVMREAHGAALNFHAKITSVEVETGMNTDTMTLYKLNALFNRIHTIKTYERASMLSMMTDKIKVVPWYSSISDDDEDDYMTLTASQLERARNGSIQ